MIVEKGDLGNLNKARPLPLAIGYAGGEGHAGPRGGLGRRFIGFEKILRFGESIDELAGDFDPLDVFSAGDIVHHV